MTAPQAIRWLLAACLCAANTVAAQGIADTPLLAISHVPAEVYTSIQGSVISTEAPPADPMIRREYYSWLFHLVLRSPQQAVRIDEASLAFIADGRVMLRKDYPRPYLEKLAWLAGAIEYNTDYFLDNIEFVDNRMESIEKPASPDVPAGKAVTWARIQQEQPFFMAVDTLRFTFRVSTPGGQRQSIDHDVPVRRWPQRVALQLPFSGVWLTRSGNDLATGHRRTGLNGVTTYAWDFMQVGDDGALFRSDGRTPEDYFTYGAPVLAPAAGTVVHVRNDIPDFGIGVTPPRELLETDGDVFAGNLVVIDHGHGEFTLTSHMKPGTIPVAVGDRVAAGDFIGEVGNSGASMVPHIHINMMDGPDWLEARGIPAVFEDFLRVDPFGTDQPIERGNPMSGWLIKPLP